MTATTARNFIADSMHALCLLLACLFALLPGISQAGVPVTLYQSFAGNMNFVETGGTLRSQPNSGNSCAVTNSSSATLSGIPAGATITAAYLYWAGSGSTGDFSVTLDGSNLAADRTFTETFTAGGTSYDFFSGFEDVTTLVAAKGNGSYTFSNLSVNNGNPHCPVSAVLSGWSLLVIYEHAAEPLRVLNVFDGFQFFRGGSITLSPNNFLIPSSGIDGRHGVLTWEGDVENSTPLGGFTENLVFNGTALTDGLNPANNQFNSTINTLGSNTAYGVDLDIYDVSSMLTAGDTSATSVYSSGADLVLLSMEVLSVTNTPVADLAISKSHSGNFSVGTNGVFTLSVSNNGPNDETGTITVTDNLPTGLGFVSGTGSGWTCGNVGQAVTCTHAGPLASGASLPDITLTVSVAAAAMPSASNTATVGGTLFDNQSANNSSSDNVTVLQPDLSTSIKTVVDLNGGDADPGDTLRYTITLIESGGATATGVSVSDNLPASTTGISIVSVPAGATDNSTATLVDVTNITVAANSSETIVFDVTVSGGASPGDTIDNTATITNPNGPGATPSAPTVIVSASSVSVSGNKPLYLHTGTLQRIVPGALGWVVINEGASSNWTLSPALQTDLTIDGSSGVIPVTLRLSERGPGQNRDFTMTLTSSTLGPIASISVTGVDLNPATTLLFNLPLISPGDKLLTAGSTLTLTVTNNTTGSGNRRVRVDPNGSFVNLPSLTVINVDSVQLYDAPYPAGSPVSTANAGDTVYVRAVVSDPFGSFDITSSTITITDPTATPVASNAAMTQVADSGVATKTYEYAYSVPVAGPDGLWTLAVTANEGTEGTISHTRIAALTVGTASLSVLKSVQTISDPVNGTTSPYNIPGAELLYTIDVSNSGAGAADTDSVFVTDVIPANTDLRVTDLGGGGSGPVLFIDGSPVSALSYTYISLTSLVDDIEFSTDGATWTYVPVADANGVDVNVRHIRINPKGGMAGDTGSGAPSFELRFVVRVR